MGPGRRASRELGYQLPLTPEQFFKAGIAAVDAACKIRYGKTFDRLAPTVGDQFLVDLAAARSTTRGCRLAAWFNELVYPLFAQALLCRSDLWRQCGQGLLAA